MNKEIIDLRHLIKGQLIRTYQLALAIHKEQEHVENILAKIDALILREEQK